MTNYLEFKERLLPEGCFSIHQARAFFPNFDRNNLTRWTAKELLVKLRQEWYAFPELLHRPDFSRYVANRIYRPSYVSLHNLNVKKRDFEHLLFNANDAERILHFADFIFIQSEK